MTIYFKSHDNLIQIEHYNFTHHWVSRIAYSWHLTGVYVNGMERRWDACAFPFATADVGGFGLGVFGVATRSIP